MQHLPPSIENLGVVLPQAAVDKLIAVFGGQRMYVPKKVTVQHRLADLLGLEQARRLSRHFGGDSMHVAKAAVSRRKNRNMEIIRRYDAGETDVRELAQAFDLTTRQVISVLNGG